MSKIVQAKIQHLDEISRLFNLYRIFYKEENDPKGTLQFIKQRLENGDSTIFVSINDDESLNGFVQLYPSFCSVSMIPILILYDLFVDPERRSDGIGRELMNKAKDFAKEKGFSDWNSPQQKIISSVNLYMNLWVMRLIMNSFNIV